MKKISTLISTLIVITVLFQYCTLSESNNNSKKATFSIAIHGGAGSISHKHFTPKKKKAYISVLDSALQHGHIILANGGSSIDAVEQVIQILEDCPYFNAGKGAVFTNSGTNELDASIMDGKTMNAGAVAGVCNIKHPISAARKVMENSKHVILSGKGATDFAELQGLEIVDSSYFFTKKSWKKLQKAIAKEKVNNEKFGTVGCVALDKHGNLAAGTSTGGMTNKKFGRIGDSPIIGAGTYANNATCAVSCTGHGEYFIRNVVAYNVSALIEYKNLPIKEALAEIITKKLGPMGGHGGIIAIDKNGEVAIDFNTKGMYRGYMLEDGTKDIKIFKQ